MSSPHPAPPSPAALQRVWRRLAAAPGAPWLNEEVARRLGERLDPIRLQPRHWADWWAFGGGGTAALRQRFPQAQGLLVEPTDALLARHRPTAGQRMRAWLGRSGTCEAQLDSQALAPESLDLLWANMVVHAVADIPALFSRWHVALRTEGVVMFSALGPDTLREWPALGAEAGSRADAPVFTDMHDLGDMLVHAGFADPVMDMERLTLTWGSAEALLADLRAWGHNVHPARFPGLRTPRWRQAMTERLTRALRGPDGRLALRFELIYGHAFKPAPRIRMAPQTEIPLSTMKKLMGLR